METEKQLLGALLDLTAEQQQAAAAVLSKLERQAQAFDAVIQKAQRAAGEMEQAARKAAPTLQQVVKDGVDQSLARNLGDASHTAAKALETASRPLLEKVMRVTQAAEKLEERLNGILRKLGWKWVMTAGGCTAIGIVTLSVLGWGAIWWQRNEITRLNEDIAQLKQQAAELEKRKARIKLEDCDGRLCAHAASDQGGYHKNWQAPWYAKDGSPLVILKGY
jgi:hypothetical protein